MIRQFRVQNFKALRDVTLDLTPIHVLVGQNDSGKSSILQALGGLCRSVDHPVSEAFVGDWSGLELVNANSDGRSATFSVVAEDALGSFEYELGLDFHNRERKAIHSRESLLVNGVKCPLPEFQNEQTRLSRLLEESHDPDSDVCQQAQTAWNALTSTVYLTFTAHHLSVPAALSRRQALEPSGFGLPALLDTILSYDRPRFVALESRLKEIFPEIETIQIPPRDAYDAPIDPASAALELEKAVGKGLYFRFKGQSRSVPASQVSGGILYALGYLAYFYLPFLHDVPRVLLIEEPENGVHPERLSEIVKILREIIGRHAQTQILMTTHSPYLLDDFEPEEVTVCCRDAEGDVKVKRLSESTLVKKDLDIFSLGEIWTAEGEEALVKEPQIEPEEVAR